MSTKQFSLKSTVLIDFNDVQQSTDSTYKHYHIKVLTKWKQQHIYYSFK